MAKYYVKVTTTIGWLMLPIGSYYRTKKDAFEDAKKARTLKDVVSAVVLDEHSTVVKELDKNQILGIVKEHPGIRKREISSIIGCWVCDLAEPMYEMEQEGLVRREYYHDNTNLEFYDKWYAT